MNQSTHFSGQPIFAQILGLVPRSKVQQLARRYGSDYYYKKFKTYDHLVAMLYTVFNRCTSLREVVTGMLACERRLNHLGLGYTPRRSTLADANGRRDVPVFEAIHQYLYRTYAAVLPDSRSEPWMSQLFIVDSTTITLFQEILKGAGRTPLSGKRKGGIKAHTLMKADEDVPRLVRLTAASTNDRSFMKEITVPPGSVITFDRAYVDYEVYNRWTEHGVGFVTRLHAQCVLQTVCTREVAAPEREAGVTSDTVVLLGHQSQANKVRARLIGYRDPETGRTFEFLTNKFDMCPSTVALIYQQRWQIELLFKRIKQNYPLQHFLGDNANAIKIQIWCALIADLLLKVIRKGCRRSWSFANLASMVRLHLMTYTNLASFLEHPERALLKERARRDKRLEWSLFPT